jgi:hypothetical protein
MAKKIKRLIKCNRSSKTRRSPLKTKKLKRPVVAKPRRYEPRLEAALKHLREGDPLSKAARKVGATPAQLRSYALATGIAERRDGKWHFKRDRRFRRMPIYTDGKRVVITVHNSKSASQIGAYMRAVRLFFETEDIELLAPFRDRSVPDVTGKRYVFETRPNVLFRLDASGVEPFELVYAIVKQE